uniref:Glycosyl transferase family 2 n=1 Tax=Cyanothece sp. (strain PCC 7425 / ATCC 29141) TaxID=395961 RepID=B8HLM9_CYAP4
MADEPALVSVIIPAYNAEAFIAQTLTSVLNQTYQNLEVIVVDDGSHDQTGEIIQKFAQKDPRVRWLQQANGGVAAARNLAIRASLGQYIAPIDADDIWFPHKLEKQVNCLSQAETRVGLVYAWSVDIDEWGELLGGFHAYQFEHNVHHILAYKNFLGHASAPLIRRSCLDKVGGYNCRLRAQNAQGCEDLDLYLRIAEHYDFRVVKEFLIGYRRVIGSMSCNYTAMARSYLLVQSEIRRTNAEIPDAAFRFFNSTFYLYLARQSSFNGHHGWVFFWVVKAFQNHLVTLLHPSLYSLLVASGLKYLFYPLTSLIWPNHRSWIQFRNRLRLRKTLSYIHRWHRIYSLLYDLSPWKFYEWYQLNRLKHLSAHASLYPKTQWKV